MIYEKDESLYLYEREISVDLYAISCIINVIKLY